MVGLYLVSENLVRALLTEKWLPSVEIFKLLCVIGLLKSIDAIIPNLLMAKGKPNLVVRFNSLCIMALPTGFLIGAQYGIQGVGYAWLATYPLISLYLYWQGLKEADTTAWQYLSNLAPAIVASLLMAIGVFAFQALDVALYGQNLYLAIGGAILVGVSIYLLSLVSFHREVMAEVRDLIAVLRAKPQASTR
jgi:O-antigen/teichoic acid export membrane protein